MKACHASAHGVNYVYESKGRVYVPYDKTQPVSQTKSNDDSLYLNPTQRNLYRLLMYGLKEFTPEALAHISDKQKKKIERNHQKAKFVIEQLKYKKYFGDYDKLFNVIFPHVKLGSRKADIFQVPKSMSMRKLQITTREVIEAFIKHELLPQNFMQLDVIL